MRGVFVTGTGTEVGKTVVAAAIARHGPRRGTRVAVFKPAVTGLDDTRCGRDLGCAPELPDHALLRRAAGSAQSDDEIAPYRYGPAVSPHLAAELAGEQIDPDAAPWRRAAARRAPTSLVCEGVGGLLVPLTRRLPGARPRPRPGPAAGDRRRRPGSGTINHTLLTIEAARAPASRSPRSCSRPGRRRAAPMEPPTGRRSRRSAGSRSRRCRASTWPGPGAGRRSPSAEPERRLRAA